MKRLAFWLSVSLAWAGAVPDAQAGANDFRVTWDGDAACITAENAPRVDVLREVARKTGTVLTGSEHLAGRLSLKSSCADLGSTLRLLAGGVSYALTELAPSKSGLRSQYALYIAEQGTGKPQVNVMSKTVNAWVSVEDPATGEMRPAPMPATAAYSTTVRPDETPVSVRVDIE